MSQPDEFLDRVPEPPLWPEPSDRCSDCEGTRLLDGEPCVYCNGSGRREIRPAPVDLKRLEAALVEIEARS